MPADLMHLIMAAANQPRPDSPPANIRPRQMRPTGYRTKKVNGKWVLVPTGFAPGRADPALRPKVIVRRGR